MRSRRSKSHIRRLLFVKEISMSGLAIASLILIIFEHFNMLNNTQLHFAEWFEMTVGVLFLAEFCVELYYARDRRKYWRHHWYFLLASIPLPFQSVDWLRGIRALRLLRLLEVFAHLSYEHNTRLLEK